MKFPSIDAEQFSQYAQFVAGLKMYPYIDAAHYVMMCILVRDDAMKQEPGIRISRNGPLSRQNPLASYVASMLMCFAGSILSNALVGQMILLPFKTHEDLILASVVWYIINYSPFDIAYKLATFFPGNVCLTVAEQLYIVHKIDKGVSYVLRNFNKSYAIACIIGVMKGAGHCYMRVLARLACGIWTPTSFEILLPSFASKASLLAAVVFILESMKYIEAPHVAIYLGIVMVHVYFSVLSSLGLGIRDPFVPFESIVCAVFFGGLVDALAKPFQRGAEAPSGGSRGGERLYDVPPEGTGTRGAAPHRQAKKDQ